MARLRNVVITLNNPTVSETAVWARLLRWGDPAFVYFVSQEERVDTVGLWPGSGVVRGTPHFQAYVELKKGYAMTWIKNKFSRRIHIERRNRPQRFIIAYCKKEASRVLGGLAGEWGRPRERAKKTTMAQFVEAINTGKSLSDLRAEYPVKAFLHNAKMIEAHMDQRGDRNWAMKILIFVGPTGTGKTFEANRLYPEAYKADWPTGGRWWLKGYEGQEAFIMDEWLHQFKIGKLMSIFDRWAMGMEFKGGNGKFLSKIVVLTTNLDPCLWFPNTPITQLNKIALERRIQEFAEIWDFSSPARMLAPPHLPVISKVRRRGLFKFAPIANVGFGVPVVSVPGYENM